MCFSAEASLTAAAALIPAGVIGVHRAYRTNPSYLAFAALPVLFGLQQLFEGFVWTAGSLRNDAWIERFSLAYMFFSWLAWPVWVPLMTYFMEPCKRRYIYLFFAILGGMVGAMQYFPYFAHDGWLVTTFLPHAIAYQGTVLFDFIMQRELTYAVYLFVIIAPLATSSDRNAQIFGLLISVVVIVVFLFFRYAYISVFCFGGALASVYILHVIFAQPPAQPVEAHSARW
jgi:hypothetical protein